MCTHWMIIISMRTWELLVPRSAQNWAVRKRKRQRVRSPWKPKPRWTVVVRLEKTVAYFMRASFPKQNDVEFSFFLDGCIHSLSIPQAAQKLMGGLTGDQVDGFFKLRTFQKPSQASQEVAQGSPTTVLPQPNKKPGTRRAAPTLFNTFIPMGINYIK